ncbi:MAG: AAA family ATPase [Myxococcales bacterium FL481]|nr:MAG: AAA family ATPase [Myxococcales bacterium FL481]
MSAVVLSDEEITALRESLVVPDAPIKRVIAPDIRKFLVSHGMSLASSAGYMLPKAWQRMVASQALSWLSMYLSREPRTDPMIITAWDTFLYSVMSDLGIGRPTHEDASRTRTSIRLPCGKVAQVNMDADRTARLESHTASVGEMTDVIPGLLWKLYGDVIRLTGTHDGCRVAPHGTSQAFPSALADRLAAAIDRRKEGILVLLYGPPGTGKSSAAMQALRNKRVVAMDPRSLDQVHACNAVVRMAPDAVLMDDLDRFRGDMCLHVVDQMMASVPCVVATVNDVQRLDRAIIRRASVFIEVVHLDDAVINRALEDVPEEARDAVRNLPISYIKEVPDLLADGLSPQEAADILNKRAALVDRIGKNRNGEW